MKAPHFIMQLLHKDLVSCIIKENCRALGGESNGRYDIHNRVFISQTLDGLVTSNL